MLFPALLASLLPAVLISVGDSTPKFVAPKSLTELEARIRTVLDSAKVPGMGLAIVRHDSIVYTGGFGRARLAPPLPATDMTLFRIGSTSKAFVALTAQALVREGRLNLDTPLSEALPGFSFTNRWEATDPVRIVNLLEHTSGFDDNSLQSYANNDPTPIKLADGLALDAATRVSRWRPGTRFSYCNTGPAIVALIIERIEGKPFEQVVQERWFTPIGMTTATYFRPDSTKLSVATLYDAGETKPLPYWHVFARPAGSINASSHDMAAYVRFLLGRGTIDGKELLPRESIERMERSESSLMSRAGLTVGYGLHLYRTSDSTGFTWTSHGGGVQGGLSDLSYLPAYGVGYAFQINSGDGEALVKIAKLVRGYITQELTPPAPPPIAPIAASTRARFAGWYRGVSPRAQHLYVTEHIPSLTRVSFTDSTMRVKPILGAGHDYVAVDSVRFRRYGQSEATLVFVRDEANDRAEGIETVGAGLGESLARVSAVNGLGGFAIAALFVVGIALSLVAMVFGALRWLVRRVRGRSTGRSVNAVPWRVSAAVALLIVVNIAGIVIGANDLQALGNLSPVSGTAWAAGILFCLGTVAAAWITWRARRVEGRWARMSLWSVRTIAAVNVVTAAYLVFWGWIGWRTWI